MISNDFASYFNNYRKISPARTKHLERLAEGPIIGSDGNIVEFPDIPYANPDAFVELDRNTYSRVYRILEDECNFRGVDPPRVFLDVYQSTSFAYSFSGLYALSFYSSFLEQANDKALRSAIAHEIKHLYQGIAQNPCEARASELDSDRAAIESAGYDAALFNMMSVMRPIIEGTVKWSVLRNVLLKVNDVFPRQIAENWHFDADENYPSMAARLKEMRCYERELNYE